MVEPLWRWSLMSHGEGMLPGDHVDTVVATAELCGRSGATNFEVGYLDDDVPSEQARWWAKAQYRGRRLQVDEQSSPVAACEALAARILDDGMCTTCGERVVTAATLEANEAAGLAPAQVRCVWVRHGRHWIAGCVDPQAEAERLDDATARRQPAEPIPNRAARRRASRGR